MPARLPSVLLLVLAFAFVGPLPGQDNALAKTPNTGSAAPAFILADVHPSPWINYPYMNGGALRRDRYTLRQATMVDLISNAYSLDPTMVQGGPSWLELDRFDIVAEAARGTSAATLRLMLRSLLASRFGLITHNGTAPMPAWVLTAVKPKLEETPGGGAECGPTIPTVANTLAVACHHMPMEQFAPLLQGFGSSYLGNKPVVDATGLKGDYDFRFQWTPSGQLAQAGADGISIFEALEKQLGLKLELRTSPRPVLLVDRVNRTPTPNAPGIEKALPPEPPPQFEVAVIKPSRPDEQEGGMQERDRLDIEGASLKSLIQEAWNLDLNDDEDVVGLQKWASSDRYDIHAKASSEDLVQTAYGPDVGYEKNRQMLRALLVERFGIDAHMEERPAAAYDFVADGPKLKPADPAERSKCGQGPGTGEKDPRPAKPILNIVRHCQNITLTEFGRQLPFLAYGYVTSPVLDDTGLQGRYDFTFSFSSEDRVQGESGEADAGGDNGSENGSPAASDPNGAVSLYEAFRRELGIRLVRVRRPIPVLVIDHINRQPSAN